MLARQIDAPAFLGALLHTWYSCHEQDWTQRLLKLALQQLLEGLLLDFERGADPALQPVEPDILGPPSGTSIVRHVYVYVNQSSIISSFCMLAAQRSNGLHRDMLCTLNS